MMQNNERPMADPSFLEFMPGLFTEEVQTILSCCVYQPSEAVLEQIAAEYHDDYNQHLYGYLMDDKVVGCIGLQLLSGSRAQIRHIAVHPDYRGRGIAWRMIKQAASLWSLRYLEAETDDDAVGFYESCGFEISDLGEQYSEVQRYLCVLRM